MSHATYTHGHHASVLRSHAVRTIDNSAAYFAPHLRPGLNLLDIGSGPGTLTAEFALRLAPGRVTAVESTPEALELTRAEARRRGVQNMDFLVSDAQALDLPDDSFALVHAHQLLQHVGDPVQALREMRRVCQPGGIVAVRDSDYAGFAWYPELPELDEWMSWYRQAARQNGGEPDAGRRLLTWARDAGFADIAPTSSTWCFSTPETREWWGGMWAERILESQIAHQLVEEGIATRRDLERVSRAWRDWAADPGGWISLLCGELVCRVS